MSRPHQEQDQQTERVERAMDRHTRRVRNAPPPKEVRPAPADGIEDLLRKYPNLRRQQ